MPEVYLKPALIYLCNPKQKILLKENMKEPKFEPDEKFSVFLDFKNANLRVSFIPPEKYLLKDESQ